MSRKRIDGGDGCTCGSGEFCHLHKIYQTPKTQEHGGEDRELQLDIQRMTMYEQCGGGRRVLRGGHSNHSKNW